MRVRLIRLPDMGTGMHRSACVCDHAVNAALCMRASCRNKAAWAACRCTHARSRSTCSSWHSPTLSGLAWHTRYKSFHLQPLCNQYIAGHFAFDVVGSLPNPYKATCSDIFKSLGQLFTAYAQVEVVPGPASEGIARLAAQGARFDLAFLDADKTGYLGYYKQVHARYFVYAMPRWVHAVCPLVPSPASAVTADDVVHTQQLYVGQCLVVTPHECQSSLHCGNCILCAAAHGHEPDFAGRGHCG